MGLSMTIVFDKDSNDFRTKRNEEVEYNDKLLSYADERTRVFMLEPDYEKAIRTEWGDDLYHKACQKHPGLRSKAIRARLWGVDEDPPIPAFMREVLKPFVEELQFGK